MLVLQRKPGESIRIGDDVFVTVIESNGKVKIGIDAPRELRITRDTHHGVVVPGFEQVTERVKGWKFKDTRKGDFGGGRKARLEAIATIIEAVDSRCIAVDGPVTDTRQEMTATEMQQIYELAKGDHGT